MSHAYYNKPIVICYSGGKDSSVILRLAEECLGIDFEVVHSHTTLDYPETVKFVEKEFKRLEEKGIKCMYRNRFPVKVTIWDLILQKKIPPDRVRRYCCQTLKETGTKNRIAVLGVRAAESHNRQGRDVFGVRGGSKQSGLFFSLDHAEEVHRESQEINDPVWDCTLIQKAKENADLTVNAIYEWTDENVWDFLKDRQVDINPLYAQGHYRVGCIGCPLARHKERMRDFERYPTYKRTFINVFQRCIESKGFRTKDKWKDGESMFKWWVEDVEQVEGQMELELKDG